ncbi:murein biosynthesis integral membrane protein MurJ [filamentous cyanobacterium LEGE 11480]|uniref:Probable lipid II flippase MurJ n=1 Tax=Romeriopsis navalis LEGE 11480 TaxID=2777977 RepID=A0A928Z388_9CYAN|nr:murein biosynthesis integral membrane protein MurJ [Romeriopsis navalis]MBE9029075.1 murein biosynthesis integral membrane protein MurJ [Romeriopsis navalis LEGE 11480]
MSTPTPPKKKSIANIAGIVAIATLVSKVFGLGRQVVLASVFGVGTAYGAFQYASIIPSFFLILLGGINGPFHSAMVSVLSKRDRKDAAPIMESVSTLIGLILCVVAIGVFIFAPQLISVVAPGLATKAPEVREIAIQQLRIMSPVAWFAGMIGIGFGALNAADSYWLPSVSPLLSSVTIVGSVGALALMYGKDLLKPEFATLGGVVLAGAFLTGTILQWMAQMIAQRQQGLGSLKFRFEPKQEAIQDVMKVMGPALFASGMLQINVYTDMFFTSFLPKPEQAVSALDYANLLAQTPLGILSNMILIPFLPVFSRLTDPENWDELRSRVRQGVLITAVAMLPLGAVMLALSQPIVRLVYERGVFNPEASALVASVLAAYAFGMFVYLSRDILVRVFYALGDGNTPFRISIVNIFFNALFDYILVERFGVPGIVLATVGVNIVSMLALVYFLDKRLDGVGWQGWFLPIVGLAGASFAGGSVSWWVSQQIAAQLAVENFFSFAVQLAIAGSSGLLVFLIIAMQLRIPEVKLFLDRIIGRFKKA